MCTVNICVRMYFYGIHVIILYLYNVSFPSLYNVYSQSEGLGVAFFATGPGSGLIMYIFTTLEFPKHNSDFHLLPTSVNAKYYY